MVGHLPPAPPATWKFPDQGSNPHHSSDPSCCSDNARCLTQCTTFILLMVLYSANQTSPKLCHWFCVICIVLDRFQVNNSLLCQPALPSEVWPELPQNEIWVSAMSQEALQLPPCLPLWPHLWLSSHLLWSNLQPPYCSVRAPNTFPSSGLLNVLPHLPGTSCPKSPVVGPLISVWSPCRCGHIRVCP